MPLTKTGIANFYDQIRQRDFSRKHQFRILKFGADKYDREIVGNSRIVYMTTASVPGLENQIKQVPYMGVDFNIPGSIKYPGSDGWQVTFRLPQDYSLRNTFEQWLYEIFSDETSRGEYNVPCPSSTVEIGLLNNAGKVIKQYRLVGAFCKSIGEIGYDVTDSGEVVTFDASIAYQYWRPVEGDSFTTGTSGVVDTITPVYESLSARNSTNNDNCAGVV